MRAAVLALLLLAVLLCTGVEAAGAPVRRLARSPTVAPEVGLTPKEICVAKCAAESAVCVYKCEHPGMLGGCKENCAITAAECAAECAFEAEAPVATMVVPESAFTGVKAAEKAAEKELVATTVVPESAFAGSLPAAAPVAAAAVADVSASVSDNCVLDCMALQSRCIAACNTTGGGLSCFTGCVLQNADCLTSCQHTEKKAAAAAQLQADKQQFDAFKAAYGKSYASEALEAHRFGIFQSNLRRAEQLSADVPTAQFGVNQFADLHPVEFRQQYLTFRPAVGDAALLRQGVPTTHAPNSSIPASYDWRKPDNNRPVGVTAVKDQGQCGSCWAFSATEALESATILAGKKSVPLSPEQTVDCDTTDGGCNGGDTVTAYAYMKQAGGVVSEASYPYTAGVTGAASTCAFKKSEVKASLKGFTYATPTCSDECKTQDEALLAANLYHNGPVSICVDASPWQLYLGGVLTSDSGCGSAYTSLDHCVQLVGYGVDATSGQKYWSVRNSWAAIWGEAGYIRLAYGANTCGVADEATQVTV